jgi:hypothetical protein
MKAADEQFEKLWAIVDSMTVEERNTDFDFADDPKLKEAHWKRDKNLRDVFVHLYEWHQLLLGWVDAHQNGDDRPFLPSPYNWRTYGQMNVEIRDKHQLTSYEDAKRMLLESHGNVMKLIDGFSNDELFSHSLSAWTGKSTLGSYCVSATSSHYDWAIKKIKKQLKALRAAE